MRFLDFLRLRQQAPTSRPPSGYYDVRINKTTGALVTVDSAGTETEVGTAPSSVTTPGAIVATGALAVTGNAILGGTLGVSGIITAPAVTTTAVTVAALPAAPSQGARAFVNDSNAAVAAAHGNEVVGGGSEDVPVFWDGTNWLVG